MPYVGIAVAAVIFGAEGIRIDPQSRSIVDAVRVGISIGQGEAVGGAFLQAELQAAIGRVGVAELVGDRAVNSASVCRVLWIAEVVEISKRFVLSGCGGVYNSRIDIPAVLQMAPLAAHEAR